MPEDEESKELMLKMKASREASFEKLSLTHLQHSVLELTTMGGRGDSEFENFVDTALSLDRTPIIIKNLRKLADILEEGLQEDVHYANRWTRV
jgi:hypothetical protein